MRRADQHNRPLRDSPLPRQIKGRTAAAVTKIRLGRRKAKFDVPAPSVHSAISA
jgi:hypothetical protein